MSRLLVEYAVLLALGSVSLGACFGAEGDSGPGDKIFGTGKVVQLHLTMSEKQLSSLSPAGGVPGFGPPGFGQPGVGQPRIPTDDAHRNTFGVEFPWGHANLELDGVALKDIGVRYKGNYTYMATARSLKKSLKVDLNKYVSGQKLDGLTAINLHCGVSDPTRARESLSYAYFRSAGVPAPRTAIAEVTLSVPGKYEKEYVGAYTLVEQVNKTFLKQHFGDGSGLLLKPEGLQGGPTYLGAAWQPYEDRYKPDNKPTAEQKKRLIAFAKLVQDGSDAEFAAEIGNYLDVDAFLRFIAANALLSNLDSYLGYGHNYYMYLVPKTNKFVFIPWDVDLSLATWPAAGMPEQLVELSLQHPHSGKDRLLDRLFAVEEHKKRYMEIVRELCSKSFTKEKLSESLVQIEKAIKEPLSKEAKAVAARKEGPAGGQFGQSMPPRRFIEERTKSVAAQLAGESKGFEPRPFSAGFGGGGGPPPGFGPPKRK
ncbi:MAG: CotH kinase family protein [Planctomycetaceae bacterium]